MHVYFRLHPHGFIRKGMVFDAFLPTINSETLVKTDPFDNSLKSKVFENAPFLFVIFVVFRFFVAFLYQFY